MATGPNGDSDKVVQNPISISNNNKDVPQDEVVGQLPPPLLANKPAQQRLTDLAELPSDSQAYNEGIDDHEMLAAELPSDSQAYNEGIDDHEMLAAEHANRQRGSQMHQTDVHETTHRGQSQGVIKRRKLDQANAQQADSDETMRDFSDTAQGSPLNSSGMKSALAKMMQPEILASGDTQRQTRTAPEATQNTQFRSESDDEDDSVSSIKPTVFKRNGVPSVGPKESAEQNRKACTNNKSTALSSLPKPNRSPIQDRGRITNDKRRYLVLRPHPNHPAAEKQMPNFDPLFQPCTPKMFELRGVRITMREAAWQLLMLNGCELPFPGEDPWPASDIATVRKFFAERGCRPLVFPGAGWRESIMAMTIGLGKKMPHTKLVFGKLWPEGTQCPKCRGYHTSQCMKMVALLPWALDLVEPSAFRDPVEYSHLCGNPGCINPFHITLEVATLNKKREFHCHAPTYLRKEEFSCRCGSEIPCLKSNMVRFDDAAVKDAIRESVPIARARVAERRKCNVCKKKFGFIDFLSHMINRHAASKDFEQVYIPHCSQCNVRLDWTQNPRNHITREAGIGKCGSGKNATERAFLLFRQDQFGKFKE